jgi:hypothetical protein
MAFRATLAVIATITMAPLLAACDLGGAGERAEAEKSVAASIRGVIDERLPDGFTLANGRGGIRDLSVSTTGNVSVVAFATVASPRAIMTHYRREAEAAGMTYAGQMEAADMIATNYRRDNPRPRTLSVAALQKGAFTNVTLSFGIAE